MNTPFISSPTFDLRFDQPGDKTAQGYLVNSLEACKPMLDHIKAQGYSSVSFGTNIPIDKNTGKIRTYDVNLPDNQDRSLPKDFWEIAKYAKSIGLTTVVMAQPVNYIDDEGLASWSKYGADFSLKEFFSSLVSYETMLAAKAQLAGVDTFYIGYLQGGFDLADNLHYWQDIVSSVRKVFSGKLAYVGMYSNISPVLGLVDELHVHFDPQLSRSAIYDIDSIIVKYSTPDADVHAPYNVIAGIKSIYEKYSKPIILDNIRFDAGANGLGNFSDYFGMALAGTISSVQPNIQLQTARITGFFELLRTQLSTQVGGFNPREYFPWMQADWIKKPNINRAGDMAFNKYSSLGFDLYEQPQTEAIYKYFIDGFQDRITGTAGSDNIWVYTGDRQVDGGHGVDTVDLKASKLADAKILSSGGKYTVNWSGGTVGLTNVERLKFADTAIALDTSGVSGQAYRVYKAAFNRTPDLGGLGFWISGMDGGESLNAVAQGFVNSAEFKAVYGASPTNAQIVTRFYDNVLGRAADSGGYTYWLGILDSGNANVAQVLASFSESSENQAAVIGVIGNGILYTPYG